MTNTSLDLAIANADTASIRRSADGLWWLDRPGSDDHLGWGGHEATLAPVIKSLLKPGRTFVNVGAHTGSWALRVAHNTHLPVIAVEANPVTAGALAFNARINHLDNLVFVWKGAASDRRGVPYHMVDEKGMASGGSTRIITDEIKGEPLATDTLDEILRMFSGRLTTGLIMIDVEGHEVQVLRGARETLLHDRPNLLVEVHDHHPGSYPSLRKDLEAALTDCAYSYTEVHMYGDEVHWVCRPTEVVAQETELGV